MLADWVFAENLRPFLLSLGWFVGRDLDEGDWTAIRYGIEATDQEADRWFDYEFVGQQRAALWLARDPGSSVVHVRTEVPAAVVPKVEAAITLFQAFRIKADA
jgi:hypothetical protein